MRQTFTADPHVVHHFFTHLRYPGVKHAETLLCETSKNYSTTEGNKMKRFIVAAILVGALVALVGGTALAAEPTTPPVPGTGVQAATCPFGGAGLGAGVGGMRQGGRPEWAGQPDEVATFLGLNQEDLQAKRRAGESLAQIAVDQGKTEQSLIDTILKAKQEVLANLVADGKLTQEQANLMIQNMTARVKTMVERDEVGPAFGQGGARGMTGRGMRGGRWTQS
jgi:hypothetical protein